MTDTNSAQTKKTYETEYPIGSMVIFCLKLGTETKVIYPGYVLGYKKQDFYPFLDGILVRWSTGKAEIVVPETPVYFIKK